MEKGAPNIRHTLDHGPAGRSAHGDPSYPYDVAVKKVLGFPFAFLCFKWQGFRLRESWEIYLWYYS